MGFFKKKDDYLSDLEGVLHTFVPADPKANLTKEQLKKNDWTLRDAVRGVQIFGGIGSGKSSGSGYTLAMSYLRNGFGGVILTGKNDETPSWLSYIKEANRLHQVVVFSPSPERYFNDYPELRATHEGKVFRFNPLQYERDRAGVGGGETRNIVNLFTSLAKMGGRATGESSGGNSGFWERAMRRCIQAAVNLLVLADKPITIIEISKIIRHTPLTGEPLHRYNNTAIDQLKEWGKEYKTIGYLLEAQENVIKEQDEGKAQTFDVVKHYLLMEYQSLAPETRSSILEHFYSLADPFRSGLLAKYFAGDSSEEVLPERTFDGTLVILDFPVKDHLEVGIYAQAIYMKLWMQAVERRNVDTTTRPVFMWVDEAQNFINPDLVMFQTTARSARACTVLISQNLSNYYASIGGSNPKDFINSLLGNLSTIIAHSQQDYVTNEWMANTIGKDYRTRQSQSDDKITFSKEFQYQFLPKNFSILRTGSPINKRIVEAVITISGKPLVNGKGEAKNYLVTKFVQKEG